MIPDFEAAIKRLLTGTAVISMAMLGACSDDDDPKKEDVPELITKATLTFTPAAGTPIVATATDPDGVGAKSIAMDGAINLAAGTTYTLTVTLINELAAPGDEEYKVSDEVKEEGDEHQFYFAWTNSVFSDPAGDGNVDNRNDKINYNDKDVNNLPIGLSTTWTAGAATSGKFHVLLKHQPDVKSATSTSNDGETDLDVTFDIVVK
jgi:hypothetical protein